MSGWGGRREGAGMPRKLTKAEARRLYNARKSGVPPSALAERYEITERTVLRYVRRYEMEHQA